MKWLRRLEGHVISLFSNVPFLYSLIIALGCLLKSLAGETAVAPRAHEAPSRELAVISEELANEEAGIVARDGARYLGAVPLPDGTLLVVSAQASRPGERLEPFVSRVLGDGRVDATFGDNGKLWLDSRPVAARPAADSRVGASDAREVPAVYKEWTATTGSTDFEAPLCEARPGN